MAERGVYSDPTFDEVARREAVAQKRAMRLACAAASRAAWLTVWRASPEYRQQRRRHIERVMMQVQRGRG